MNENQWKRLADTLSNLGIAQVAYFGFHAYEHDTPVGLLISLVFLAVCMAASHYLLENSQ
jgi:hypothetical protein